MRLATERSESSTCASANADADETMKSTPDSERGASPRFDALAARRFGHDVRHGRRELGRIGDHTRRGGELGSWHGSIADGDRHDVDRGVLSSLGSGARDRTPADEDETERIRRSSRRTG